VAQLPHFVHIDEGRYDLNSQRTAIRGDRFPRAISGVIAELRSARLWSDAVESVAPAGSRCHAGSRMTTGVENEFFYPE
jgi:hypothetical protein